MKVRVSKVALATLASIGFMGGAWAQKAEVIHWLTAGGEAAAIKEMADMYTKSGGTVPTPRCTARRSR